MSVRTKWYAGFLQWFLSTTYETLLATTPLRFEDDFLGKALDTTNTWQLRDTGAATQTLIADGHRVELALTSANEVQLAGMDWNDQRPFALAQALAIEIRFRFTVLPTGAVVAVLGLCGDHNAAVNTVAESIWVRADGSGVLTLESDDTVNERNAIASGVTLTAGTWCILRIECEDPAAIRFYLNGVRVAAATVFNMNQVPSLLLQPVARIGKEAAATTVGTLEVDYFKIWQKRA